MKDVRNIEGSRINHRLRPHHSVRASFDRESSCVAGGVRVLLAPAPLVRVLQIDGKLSLGDEGNTDCITERVNDTLSGSNPSEGLTFELSPNCDLEPHGIVERAGIRHRLVDLEGHLLFDVRVVDEGLVRDHLRRRRQDFAFIELELDALNVDVLENETPILLSFGIFGTRVGKKDEPNAIGYLHRSKNRVASVRLIKDSDFVKKPNAG